MPADGKDSARLSSIGDYYSAAQLRADRWSALREATDRLAQSRPDGRGAQKLIARTEALFEALGPIEMYWAFPGVHAFDHLRRQLEHRNWEELAFSVRRVVRALTSGAYRRRHIPLARDEAEVDDIEDESTIPVEARALARQWAGHAHRRRDRRGRGERRSGEEPPDAPVARAGDDPVRGVVTSAHRGHLGRLDDEITPSRDRTVDRAGAALSTAGDDTDDAVVDVERRATGVARAHTGIAEPLG